MNDATALPQPAVTLSREELLAVLNVLRAAGLPGLENEPSAELTPEQEEFAIVIARRALLARGLARIRADGEFLLQRGLLAAIGACAYPQLSMAAYTWAPGADTPQRLFGHVRAGDCVAHAPVDSVLHRFTVLPSQAALVEQVLMFCEFNPAPPPAVYDFAVPSEEYVRVRERAMAGDTTSAREVLAQVGAPEEGAAWLAAAWASAPRVSVLQTLARQENQTARVHEFTLVQSGQQGWWAAPTSPEGPVRVRTISGGEIRDLLGGTNG